MVYGPGQAVRIVDLATGRVLFGATRADSSTGEVTYFLGQYELQRGETQIFKRYSNKTSSGFTRRQVTKIIPFDVVDEHGNVIDKARP